MSSPAPTPTPSLDGRRFVAPSATVGGEVGPDTVFEYHEADGVVWAEYAGGDVRRGFLVGTRDSDVISFRYAQLSQSGETSTGRCVSQIVISPDGRLQLDETWAWESKDGSGTSVVIEVVG